MIHKTIFVSADDRASLTVYAPENYAAIDPERRRPAVVLCPGGGYAHLSDREAEPVALQLLAADLCVFVLRYSLAPEVYPAALTQLAAAVAHVRANAEEYHVDPEKISVMGFSAGGHLAASLGVRWHCPWLSESLGLQPEDIRPNGMVLCYPVISAGEFAHKGSIKNLTGSEDPAAWQEQSLEQLVSDATPPAFLWHTALDSVVPVENSVLFFSALHRQGVSAELHIFPKGDHGLALCNAMTACKEIAEKQIIPDLEIWLPLAVRWLKAL